MQDTKLDEELKKLSINVYRKNEKKDSLGDWSLVNEYSNEENGFYSQVYKKGKEVAIVYSGSDDLKDWSTSNIPMAAMRTPRQLSDAQKVYKQVAKHFPSSRIILTGHSLGGSLAQLVSAESGRKAVTFNAYGTGDLLNDMGYSSHNQRLMDIKNYGNHSDAVFMGNVKHQPGKTYVTNTELNPKDTYIFEQGIPKKDNIKQKLALKNNHRAENIDKLSNGVQVVDNFNIKPPLLKGSVSYDDYDPYTQKAEVLAKLKEPQESRLEKIKNKIFKSKDEEKDFDEDADYSDYINEVTKNNKIYTKEDLASMSEDELQQNQKAIDYQKQKIGIPSAKQAKASGMVYVSGYTRSDGIQVKSYYRARPSFT